MYNFFMKSINTQLKNLAFAYLRRLTPFEISLWQDWLRAVADALPALRRDEKLRTSDELRDCELLAKQQERLNLELWTESGNIPIIRWTTRRDPNSTSPVTVTYTELPDKSIRRDVSETVPLK